MDYFAEILKQMKTGKPAFPAAIGKAAIARTMLAAAMLAAPALARPAAAEPMSLRYAISVGGFNAMKMIYDGNAGKKSYKAHVVIKPSGGFLSLFIKKSFDLGGSGVMTANGARPAYFYMNIKKKKKLRKGVVHWKGGKLAWEHVPPPSPKERAELFRAMGKGAPDPLSLVIGLARRDPAASCKGTRRVFDAHDVYDLRLSLGGRKNIKSPAYSGQAVLCRMRFSPVAGYSEKKRRKIRKNPWVFNVWLAPVMSRDAGRLMVPVGAFGSLDGRKFTASLVKASIGGRRLSAR